MAIETLGDALKARWRIVVRCREGKGAGMKKHRVCVSTAELDLETIVWTRGADMPLSDLALRMRCPQCKQRRVSVQYIVSGEPTSVVMAAPPPRMRRIA